MSRFGTKHTPGDNNTYETTTDLFTQIVRACLDAGAGNSVFDASGVILRFIIVRRRRQLPGGAPGLPHDRPDAA